MLYLGEEDWSKTHDIPEHIEFTFCKSIRSFPVELKKRIADVVILEIFKEMSWIHCVF